ncbi:MAG TPA: sulfatase-like hydrolase/transferase [Sedimentisphaerales bacterium]|nr:sulfatase-like hydrolase/transferase [Sedimentisphaerales bacterium]
MAGTMTRRKFLIRSAGLAALSVVCPGSRSVGSQNKQRPNIVLIMADDLGYGDVGCYGCSDIRTPAIDGLAAEGVRFTTFYSNAPECTPTRTALLTGRYQHRVGGLECALGIGNVGRYDDAIRLRRTNDLGLPVEETSIARMLKDAGYATTISGKWHLGYEPKFFPLKHGFDSWFGPVGGSADYFHHIEYTGEPALYENDKPVKREGYLTDLITDEAVGFIQRRQKKPFLLYVAYTAPHTPYQGPGDKKPEPVPEADYNKGSRETYAAMVERMDQGIGRILKGLDDAGLVDNTLVIFMSDNGANKTGDNSPFSGFKGNLFEGGIRVPCIVKWLGVLARGAVSDQPCMTMDFSRSIVRAAGAKPPAGRAFDGMDILRVAATNRPVQKRTLFWRARRAERTRKAVRDGSLKYIRLQDGDDVKEYLFDLQRDPAEKNNLLNDQPENVRKLKTLLQNWQQEVKHKR